MISVTILSANSIVLSDQDFAITVNEDIGSRITIEYSIPSYDRKDVDIDGNTYSHLSLSNESFTYDKGKPELPLTARSIIIPDMAKMELKIISAEYREIELDIAPSKGMLFRDQDPDAIPYTFDEIYQTDAFYPANFASLSDPYIMRDLRGITVRVNPIQYNPKTGIVRLYSQIELSIEEIGIDDRNIKTRTDDRFTREFGTIYKNHFINFDNMRYEPVDDHGRMIVIAYDAFMDATIPYVNWKRQKGIPTDIYPVSEIGNEPADIKNFILNAYNSPAGLTFVQLVGDAAQVPTFDWNGGGADPLYALLEGEDDYPDIFVGRFSAETTADLETQIERSIYYERDISEGDWLHKATGIASNDAGGTDIQHLNMIRDKLLDYNYSFVDQIYDPGAQATDVMLAVNEGRSLINYTGHGSSSAWVTSNFNINHVNSLENDYLLPFIISVACVNGNFTNMTCFAEAWLRATNNQTGAPTGAISMYASSVNQAWYPPMDAQDEAMDLLIAEENTTIGGLFFNGSCRMIDMWGLQGASEFNNWIIFGDSSLQVRSSIPEPITASYLPILFIGMDEYTVSTNTSDALVSLIDDENNLIASGYTDTSGEVTLLLNDPPTEPTELTLTISGYNMITYISSVEVTTSEDPYIVLHSHSICDESGNNNGLIDYGEYIELSVELKNVGNQISSDLSVELSTTSENITILDAAVNVDPISAGETSYLQNVFSFEVAHAIPDNYEIDFSLNISGDQNWTSTFSLIAYAPVLEYVSYMMDDSDYGNGDGIFDPGESVDILITVANVGSSEIANVTGLLTSSSPHIFVDQISPVGFGELQPGDTAMQPFKVTAAYTTPQFYEAYFDIQLLTDYPIQSEDSFATTIGDYYINETFEQWLPTGWHVASAGANENWHQNESSHAGGESPEARFRWSPITQATQRLIIPALDTEGVSSVELEFKYSIDDYNGDYELRLESSSDGDNWDTIMDFPSQNIPATMVNITLDNEDIGSGNFQLAWTFEGNSGNINFWYIDDVLISKNYDFDMAYFEGTVTLNDNVGSLDDVVVSAGNQSVFCEEDGYYQLPVIAGLWDVTASHVDYNPVTVENIDIPAGEYVEIDFALDPVDADDEPIASVTKFIGNYPNPFNPETNIVFNLAHADNVSIEIYNIKGQKMMTLLDEFMEAGTHSVVWNGRDRNGRAVASGVYLTRLNTRQYTSTRKMLLLK
jgi:hypothetical protein